MAELVALEKAPDTVHRVFRRLYWNASSRGQCVEYFSAGRAVQQDRRRDHILGTKEDTLHDGLLQLTQIKGLCRHRRFMRWSTVLVTSV